MMTSILGYTPISDMHHFQDEATVIIGLNKDPLCT